MRTVLLLALTILSLGALAADEAALLEKLTDDDFDVREQATRDLGQYPEDCAVRFIRMADEPGRSPEQAMRLRMAGWMVFENKVLQHDDRWMNANSDIGCTVELRFQSVQKFKVVNGTSVMFVKVFLWGVEIISHGWGASEDKLDMEDVIVAIDGKTLVELSGEDILEKICGYDLVPFIHAGQEHELTVRHYGERKTNEYNIKERVGPDDTDYVERKVKITPNWLDADRVGPVQKFQMNRAHEIARQKFLKVLKDQAK